MRYSHISSSRNSLPNAALLPLDWNPNHVCINLVSSATTSASFSVKIWSASWHRGRTAVVAADRQTDGRRHGGTEGRTEDAAANDITSYQFNATSRLSPSVSPLLSERRTSVFCNYGWKQLNDSLTKLVMGQTDISHKPDWVYISDVVILCRVFVILILLYLTAPTDQCYAYSN